ncbi:transporter substrate-binding domain-containing protein [Acetomicrobium sp. S15 = DSM 107314]|jgi:cyclohexadienyl dehydratase|uniref:transporter substrate-binding domain-containing protein n=1 Tax=Acetomicrobium sp. S15 = DSM 107314 TaxID=2529858 RepID=UPI0018E136D6|nr:transporter substrate-binding domain-containing protein [Acetomicrobium sp. S15 = DSM 107314]
MKLSKGVLKRRFLLVAAVVAILSLAIGNLAVAAGPSRLDEILERGVVKVGTTGDYKPFTYLNKETKEYEGIDIDMARSLAKALGVKLEFVPTTWKNIVTDLVEDKYDVAVGGISKKLDRQMKVFFTIPYMETGKAPITRKENVNKFQTLEQIDQENVTVIVNPGGTNEQFVRENLKKAKILVYDDNVTIFDQIVAGKADLMITDAVETLVQERIHPELAAVNPDKPFTFTEFGYMLPRGDIIFKEWVDLWLHTALKTGQFKEIFDSHIK